MEKLVIYPYDIQFAPVLRHRGLMEDYDIVGLAAPNGWGLSSRDAGYVDGGESMGITSHNKLDDLFDLCDTVLFIQPETLLDFSKVILPNIKRAIDASKNIISNLMFEDHVEHELTELCRNKGVYLKEIGFNTKINYTQGQSEKIFEVKTPVIFVLGTAERTHKFEIQLCLRQHLQKMGYRISQIGSRNYCELLGFHSLPSFMYNCTISESSKIVLLNHYVKKIEAEEKPDIIIIGIPGGIMPFNNQFTNKFGVLAYEISQAISPDSAILSTLYEDFNQEYFELLFKSVKYKLGFEVTCFNLANIQFDWETSKTQDTMAFTTINTDIIEKKKKNFNMASLPVYNIFNSNDACTMTNFLVDKLAGYAEVESF